MDVMHVIAFVVVFVVFNPDLLDQDPSTQRIGADARY